MIMGHVGDTAFFCPGKKPISPGHVQKKKKKKKKKKNISPHSEHSAVLPLTPHTISNRQTCQKEKCMINRLGYGNFHIKPHINPRHPYQPEGLRPSG